MNKLFFINIYFDKQYHLYELLKLKKGLENIFLKNQIRLNNKRLKLKGFLLTGSFSYILNNNVLELINLVQVKLDKNFSKFKKNGERFEIDNLSEISDDDIPYFFDKLFSFNSSLEEFNSSLIVQGSYADNTFISYSDLDLVIIGFLSEDVNKIKNEIEEFLISIDPLQHHGVFFINKDSFRNYWQMDLPIETLKKALILSKTSTFKINISYYFNEKISSYNWVSNFYNGYPVLPITLNSGVFFTKYFLSQLLLVPALFLATKGNYIYKRESFYFVEKYYSKEAWKCMEIASSIRENWDQKLINSRYRTVRKNSTIKNVKEFNTFSDVINIEKEQIEEFADKYVIFINETKKLLKGRKNEI